MASLARHNTQPGLPALRLFYGLLTTSILVSFAPLLGLLQVASLTLQGTLVQGLVSACMMGLLLHARSSQLSEIGQQARIDLVWAQQELHAKHARLSEQQNLMTMLTHEIKNPLATIGLTLDTLHIDAPRRSRIERAIRDMNAIIERCRQADQLEQNRLPSQIGPFNLPDLLHHTIAACAEPTRIHLHHGPAQTTLQTDPQLLSIAVANLIDNALKYGAPGAAVDIGWHPLVWGEQTGTCICVSNQVGPIGPPDPVHLFQKYHRSPQALGKSGSGLGLYLVRSLMTQLGGRATCTAANGHTHFNLWIPP